MHGEVASNRSQGKREPHLGSLLGLPSGVPTSKYGVKNSSLSERHSFDFTS